MRPSLGMTLTCQGSRRRTPTPPTARRIRSYNPEGTLAVSMTGNSGKTDENTETYSVVYARSQPGLPEKAIISLNQQKVICQ